MPDLMRGHLLQGRVSMACIIHISDKFFHPVSELCEGAFVQKCQHGSKSTAAGSKHIEDNYFRARDIEQECKCL